MVVYEKDIPIENAPVKLMTYSPIDAADGGEGERKWKPLIVLWGTSLIFGCWFR